MRNARLNFRQAEENRIMENIIFNEMRVRGYQLDVGVMEAYSKDQEGFTDIFPQLQNVRKHGIIRLQNVKNTAASVMQNVNRGKAECVRV